eukprot:3727788-Rhodomonas_salina.1
MPRRWLKFPGSTRAGLRQYNGALEAAGQAGCPYKGTLWDAGTSLGTDYTRGLADLDAVQTYTFGRIKGALTELDDVLAAEEHVWR